MSGRRRALIIATDTYDDAELSRLTAPEQDAEELAGVLRDPELGGFEVDVAHNGASYEVAQRIETLLADAEPDDLVLIHFSGHGIKNKDGELVLAASNTRPRNLYSTGIKAADVQTLIFRSRSRRKILVLDCCYGGAFSRGLLPRAAGTVDVGDAFLGSRDRARGCAVITASTAMEFAFEDASLARSDTRSPSIFTGALVEGLQTGKADRDQDGRVSLSELYDYVYDRVRERSPNQTPSMTEYELQGELFIANNPHRLVTPGELPAGLLEKVTSDDKYTRLGAVSVLREHAAGSDLPVAAAARLALARLLDDDSRKVAEDARTALDATRLRATPATLDLGPVERGAPAPEGTIRIEGPPLADSLLVTASAGSIRVRRTGRDVHVRLDTASEGEIDASIELSGPAGTETVKVRGSVVAFGSTAAAAADGPGGLRPANEAAPGRLPWTAPEAMAARTPMNRSLWARFREQAPAAIVGVAVGDSESPSGAAAAIPAASRRMQQESAHVWVRGIAGGLIAASMIGSTGEWLPIMNQLGDTPPPVVAATAAVLTAILLRLLEIVPALRVPDGVLVGIAGRTPWRAAAIQGFLFGIVVGLVQSVSGASDLVSFAVIPFSFAFSFAIVEAVSSFLADF